MESGEQDKRCPYLREVLMVFCEACPIKKMVPLARVTAPSHCFGQDFAECPMFAEITARIHPPQSKKASRPRSNGARSPRIR